MTSTEFVVRQTLKASSDFITHVKDMTFTHISGLLKRKGTEYSTNENRFENFLDYALSEGCTPEQALRNMMMKHSISIKKFVNEIATDQRRPFSQWVEKIDDEITYLILLKAMTAKRQEIEKAIHSKESEKDTDERQSKTSD